MVFKCASFGPHSFKSPHLCFTSDILSFADSIAYFAYYTASGSLRCVRNDFLLSHLQPEVFFSPFFNFLFPGSCYWAWNFIEICQYWASLSNLNSLITSVVFCLHCVSKRSRLCHIFLFSCIFARVATWHRGVSGLPILGYVQWVFVKWQFWPILPYVPLVEF